MDMEKYTSSKLYYIFEWGYRLIIWNLLTLLIVCIFSSIPFICFFGIRNNVSIELVEVINEDIYVTQKNDVKTNIGLNKIYGDILNIQVYDIYITFDIIKDDIDNNSFTYQFKINNQENIRNIEKCYFDTNNDFIIIYDNNKIYNLGDLYNSEFDLESTKVDAYQDVIISYNNGLSVNYGRKLDVSSTLTGILIIIGLAMVLFSFIPCFITTFTMIKIYSEDGSCETIRLYLLYLKDNFKNIYKLELFLIPLIVLFSYGLYTYYYILINNSDLGFFYTISYDILLVCLILIILFILNLPMSLGYFKMSSLTIFRFTVRMMFKNLHYSLIYLVIMCIPVLLSFAITFFMPVWFLIGFSLPLVFMYLVSSRKYHALVNEFNNDQEEE